MINNNTNNNIHVNNVYKYQKNCKHIILYSRYFDSSKKIFFRICFCTGPKKTLEPIHKYLSCSMRCLKLCMCVERNESPDTVPEGAWWLWSGVETRLDVSGLGTGVARTTGRLLLNMIKKNRNLLHIVHAQFSRLGIRLFVWAMVGQVTLPFCSFCFLKASVLCTCMYMYMYNYTYKQIDVRVPG